MSRTSRNAIFSAVMIVALTVFAVPTQSRASSDRTQLRDENGFLLDEHGHPVLEHPGVGNILYSDGNGLACRAATPEETRAMAIVDRELPMQILNPEVLNKGTTDGLTLILVGTTQLDSFPAAKAAYIRAADTWMELIGTPITVAIRVDFGPTRFGESYPGGVLGSTDPQFHPTNDGFISLFNYPTVRSAMLARSDSTEETALLSKLPASSVPTTVGNSTQMAFTTALQRALGLLGADANPDAAYLPSVGLNSAFPYDFDPSNGIDFDKQDFNATALHEIGHALGFNSWSGIQELSGSFPVLLTTWDLFRFRPGVNSGTFSTAMRVLSSGGEHHFFVDMGFQRLSTGRPNGSGGDNNQASHWKDNVQNSGNYIGIMDPTGANGDLDEITQNDLDALDYMGFKIGSPIKVIDISGGLFGNTLNFTGLASAPGDDVASAEAVLLDGDENVLGMLTSQLDVARGDGLGFSVEFTGLEDFLGATQADITILSSTGGRSSATRVDLTVGDAGARPLNTAKFAKQKKIRVTGSGFTNTDQLEVNGVVVTPPLNFKAKPNGSKANIKGTMAQFGLVAGPNRIRVITAAGLRSDIFILEL